MLMGDFSLDFTIVGLLGLWPTSFYMRCKYLCILSSGVREEVDIIVKRLKVYKIWNFKFKINYKRI